MITNNIDFIYSHWDSHILELLELYC